MAQGNRTVTEVSITSNPDYLSRLRRIIGCLADCAGMDAKEVHDAKLAVTEACANAIRHGSPKGPADKVSIKFSQAGGTVITEVTDHGTGFDPDNVTPRPIAQPGGLGIPLMKALSDEIEFHKNGKGMTVRLIKRASSPHRRRYVRIVR